MKLTKLIKTFLLSASFSTMPPTLAQVSPISNESLCTADEDIYFSCELEEIRKIASVCAKGNSSPDDGYVQYRFGTKQRLDLEYPKEKISPQQSSLSIIDVSRTSLGLGTHLKFSSRNFHYVVSTSLIPGEIYVEKNARLIFRRTCKNGVHTNFPDKSRKGIPWGHIEPIDKPGGG